MIACAAAVACIINGWIESTNNDTTHQIVVHLKGGDLTIEYNPQRDESVYMIGPSNQVFTGEYLWMTEAE